MAEKKTIELEVKDNLQPTIQNLRELKKQLKETAAGSKDFDKISAQIRDMDDAISDAKATNDDFLGQLENASGPLGMLGKSIRGAERTFSSFNGALKTSVIGLIVSLIGGLVAAFQDNEVAMKKLQPLLDGMQKLFQGIFRAVEPLFNTLVDLAVSALPTVSKAFGVVYSSVTAVFQSLGLLGGAIKKLISGDFSGAWKDAKSSVNDFSKNYDASIKRFNDGTKEMSKTEKEEAEKRAEARKAADEKRKEQQEKAKQDAIAKKKEEADALRKIEEDRIAAEMDSARQAISILDELNKSKETPAQKEQREYEEKKAILLANNLDLTLLNQQHEANLA
jgi:DNA segregation ATPase FtsK/SpoIIIE-like protein